MSNRVRIYTKVTPEELARIKEKMAEVDVRNRSAYLRKMALDGYCVNMDFSDIRELVSLLRRCSNNLNQYAKKANETNNIYGEDVENLRKDVETLCLTLNQSLYILRSTKASPIS